MTMLETDAGTAAREVKEVGYTVLRGALPIATIERWALAFQPVWTAYTARPVPTNRGPGRWYIDLPFAWPFCDPEVLAHPEVLAVVEEVIGKDPLLLHIGTDTPTVESVDQDVHGDIPELFPAEGLVTPTPAVAVNFPFVDVTEANGPFCCYPGSHLLRRDEGQQRLRDGRARLEPVLLNRGDVLIRDPRMLHRGTANRSGCPRPVAVVAYQRSWYRHGFEPIGISPPLRETLSDRMRQLLRLHLDHHRQV